METLSRPTKRYLNLIWLCASSLAERQLGRGSGTHPLWLSSVQYSDFVLPPVPLIGCLWVTALEHYLGRPHWPGLTDTRTRIQSRGPEAYNSCLVKTCNKSSRLVQILQFRRSYDGHSYSNHRPVWRLTRPDERSSVQVYIIAFSQVHHFGTRANNEIRVRYIAMSVPRFCFDTSGPTLPEFRPRKVLKQLAQTIAAPETALRCNWIAAPIV